MYCGNCASEIKDYAKYCPNCGNIAKPEPSPNNYVQNGHNSSPSGFSVASLIFGIIAIQILAFIFGGIAISKAKQTGQPTGLAKAGIILGIVWTIIAVCLYFL